MARMIKCLPTVLETWVRFLGWEDSLEKEMAIHSSTLAWKIPWTEESGRLQSIGSQRVWKRLSDFPFTSCKLKFLRWVQPQEWLDPDVYLLFRSHAPSSSQLSFLLCQLWSPCSPRNAGWPSARSASQVDKIWLSYVFPASVWGCLGLAWLGPMPIPEWILRNGGGIRSLPRPSTPIVLVGETTHFPLSHVEW